MASAPSHQAQHMPALIGGMREYHIYKKPKTYMVEAIAVVDVPSDTNISAEEESNRAISGSDHSCTADVAL